MTIGSKIRKYRELRGLSVEQLAQKMGIKKAGIYQWESDSYKPGQESLTKLSQALGISVSELIDENHTSVPQTDDNKLNGMHAKETFYQDLIEKNDEYSLLPRAVLRDYKIVPDKIIDVLVQSNENEKKALIESKELEIKSLNEKYETLIQGYENKIKRLEKENEDLRRGQIPGKDQ